MGQQLPEEWFVSDARVNAAIAWVLTAVLAVIAGYSLLSFRMVDVLLAGTAVLIALVPALVAGSWTRTVPWPLLALASTPVLLRVLQPGFFQLVVTGVGIAALGMLLVSTLQLVTSVRMTPGFAVAFTLLTTLAFAGYWAVGSAASAAYLGTSFVDTNTELMHIFTAALLGGLVGGAIFRWYFRRRLRQPAKTPAFEEVEPV
ncbi:hypothetical protein [Haloarchaeobius sp. HME9146]|uniref:hypothetical protein n=1 Tax=Haloarchaeobius sp. HME9146 TaxID=2978732 RepID=UPI0021C211A6|nr:hypothetical protein [Haloarchaeobius sp. HME9146]MCT9097172.1 hypothetical protein [Haloarchaeobius sp. HME9146]